MAEYRWTSEGTADQSIAEGYEILLRPDGSEVTCITEPEDRVSYRDLKPVTEELNALAKRVEALETLLENLYHEDIEWAKSDERYRFGRAAVALVALNAEAQRIAERRAGRKG